MIASSRVPELVIAGVSHLHFGSNPAVARSFVSAVPAMTKAAIALLISMLVLPVAADAWSVTDPTGAPDHDRSPARRIVSLVPSVTELMYAIGAQDLLVGVTDFCDYPPAARQKPRVGGMLAPSLETLVALEARPGGGDDGGKSRGDVHPARPSSTSRSTS